MAIRKHLLLPEGYTAKHAGAIWCLADPHGVELLRSTDASAVEIHAWRHLWRRRHEDFNEELAAFRSGALLPDLAGRHEPEGASHDLVEAPQRAAAVPWPALAAAVAATAAAFIIGLSGIGPVRVIQTLAPLPSPNQRAASIAAAPKLMAVLLEHTGVPEIVQAATPPRPRARYAVSVGNYANPATADRMKHLVRGKGYIVDVVQEGAVSQVVTPPYHTRAQAERIARAFEEIRLPAQLVARAAM